MAEQMDWQKRRALLNSRVTDKARCIEAAKECLEEGFLSDAVDFFVLGEDRPALEGMTEKAVEEGDLFLLGRIKKALGSQASLSELEKLTANARQLGKETFAVQAEKLMEALKSPKQGMDGGML